MSVSSSTSSAPPLTPTSSTFASSSSPLSPHVLTPPASLRVYSTSLRAHLTAGWRAALLAAAPEAARGADADERARRRKDVEYGYDEDPFDVRARMIARRRDGGARACGAGTDVADEMGRLIVDDVEEGYGHGYDACLREPPRKVAIELVSPDDEDTYAPPYATAHLGRSLLDFTRVSTSPASAVLSASPSARPDPSPSSAAPSRAPSRLSRSDTDSSAFSESSFEAGPDDGRGMYPRYAAGQYAALGLGGGGGGGVSGGGGGKRKSRSALADAFPLSPPLRSGTPDDSRRHTFGDPTCAPATPPRTRATEMPTPATPRRDRRSVVSSASAATASTVVGPCPPSPPTPAAPTSSATGRTPAPAHARPSLLRPPRASAYPAVPADEDVFGGLGLGGAAAGPGHGADGRTLSEDMVLCAGLAVQRGRRARGSLV
ncbi:hypothetical protein Q5752_007068 [Cryptotrichosporon argae]